MILRLFRKKENPSQPQEEVVQTPFPQEDSSILQQAQDEEVSEAPQAEPVEAPLMENEEAPALPTLPITAPIVVDTVAVPVPNAPAEVERASWLTRLRQGLSRSSSRLTDGIGGIFTKRKLDDETLEELEELLITADLGPVTAAKITAALARNRFGKEISPAEVRTFLSDEIAKVLAPIAKPLAIDPDRKPHVMLVVGVNGAGKTTTIGKLADLFREGGKQVMIAAGDTFRAAAVEQLKVWGERAGVPVIARETGADAAGLAYDALEKARAEQADILLIDTAGRLQNKTGLMAELQKIVRVLKKVDPDAPHSTLLVLDATTGQNAHSQVEIFRNMVAVDGLVLTKLDGSARGGVLVALAEKFGLPVHAIGVGERIDDLRAFSAEAFAKSLLDVEEQG